MHCVLADGEVVWAGKVRKDVLAEADAKVQGFRMEGTHVQASAPSRMYGKTHQDTVTVLHLKLIN